jgi:hypothetical protein
MKSLLHHSFHVLCHFRCKLVSVNISVVPNTLIVLLFNLSICYSR